MKNCKVTITNKNNIEAKHKLIHNPYEYYKYESIVNSDKSKLT